MVARNTLSIYTYTAPLRQVILQYLVLKPMGTLLGFRICDWMGEHGMALTCCMNW